MLRTSVVICAYTDKRWDLLRETVMSVRDQTHAPHEIILVVDNNPRLRERCAREFEGITVVANTGNGLADARNTGAETASGDIIAFIDDDAVAEPDWIACHMDVYNNDTGGAIIGVGGFISPRWETYRPAWLPYEFDWVVSATYRGMPVERSDIRNGIGTNLSFRRLAFANGRRFIMGRRNGSIAYNNDETEFCIRVQQEVPGSRMVYEPAARVRHFVPADRGTIRYFIRRCFFEGLSKHKMSTMVGRDTGLASERTYATRTLPLGVLRGIGDGARLQFSGFARAAMIVLGLASTTTGFVVGAVKQNV